MSIKQSKLRVERSTDTMAKNSIKKVEEKNFNGFKFWEEIDIRVVTKRKKRVWLSEVTPVSKNTINTQANKGTFPRITDAYYIAKALDTSIEQLLEDSIE